MRSWSCDSLTIWRRNLLFLIFHSVVVVTFLVQLIKKRKILFSSGKIITIDAEAKQTNNLLIGTLSKLLAGVKAFQEIISLTRHSFQKISLLKQYYLYHIRIWLKDFRGYCHLDSLVQTFLNTKKQQIET